MNPRNRIAREYDEAELEFLAGRPHFVDSDPAVRCDCDPCGCLDVAEINIEITVGPLPKPARKICSDYLLLGLMLAASVFMWGLIIWKVGQVITADPDFK